MIYVEGQDKLEPKGPVTLAFVEVPRCGSTWLRDRLIRGGVGVEDTRLVRHSSACTLEGGRHVVVATIRHPWDWYRSFWRYFVQPPEHIYPIEKVQQSHLELAQGQGFNSWLERVTVLGTGGLPVYLPISTDGVHEVRDFAVEFERAGTGLFSFVWNTMVPKADYVIRMGPRTGLMLDTLLMDYGVNLPFGGLPENEAFDNIPAKTDAKSLPLTTRQAEWILTADAPIIDTWRL